MQNALYLFRPSPGGQSDMWYSMKPHSYVLGANFAGKTYGIMMMAAAFVMPHPNDPKYAYWPCAPDDEQLTNKLRDQWRIKLPTDVWLVEDSRKTHRSITMGGRGRLDRLGLQDILGPYIDDPVWSDEKGVWDYVDLKNGSRLTLMSAQAGWRAFTGPTLDGVFIDEPQSPAIINECIARVGKGAGKFVYVCTPIVDHTKPESWENILWLKNSVLAKGESETVDIITGMSIENNIGLSQRRKKRMISDISASAMSQEEKQTRLTGEILLDFASHFMDVDVCEMLLSHAKAPVVTGYLNIEGEIVPKTVANPNITYNIWEYPKDGCYYSLGLDPSGEHDTATSQTAARVWCDRPRRLVAEAVGNATEPIWAKEIDKLGRMYTPGHPAKVAIEIFVYGREILSFLLSGNKTYGINLYPHIYKEPRWDDLKAGKHKPSGAYGWGSGGGNAKQKRGGILFPTAREALRYSRDNPEAMPDAEGLMEYMNTVIIDGRPDAAPGQMIDRVVADGLAWLVFAQKPFDYLYPVGREEAPNPFKEYIEDGKIYHNPDGRDWVPTWKPPGKRVDRRLFQ